MPDQAPDGPPIACTLSAGDFVKRLAGIAKLNAAALMGRRRRDLTLELTYRVDAAAEVLRMVRGEQECCAFLAFEVRQEPDAVRVSITAPEAARDAAAVMFEAFQAKAAPSADWASGCGCCG
jgi:hypothetical protein